MRLSGHECAYATCRPPKSTRRHGRFFLARSNDFQGSNRHLERPCLCGTKIPRPLGRPASPWGPVPHGPVKASLTAGVPSIAAGGPCPADPLREDVQGLRPQVSLSPADRANKTPLVGVISSETTEALELAPREDCGVVLDAQLHRPLLGPANAAQHGSSQAPGIEARRFICGRNDEQAGEGLPGLTTGAAGHALFVARRDAPIGTDFFADPVIERRLEQHFPLTKRQKRVWWVVSGCQERWPRERGRRFLTIGATSVRILAMPFVVDAHAALLAGLAEGFARSLQPLTLADVAQFANRAGPKMEAVKLGDVLHAASIAYDIPELEREYSGELGQVNAQRRR